MSGYHVTKIKKGAFGEASKITEEYEELLDALSQNNDVMVLCELSDLIGAIGAFSSKRYNISLESLLVHCEATKRAFDSGKRS